MNKRLNNSQPRSRHTAAKLAGTDDSTIFLTTDLVEGVEATKVVDAKEVQHLGDINQCSQSVSLAKSYASVLAKLFQRTACVVLTTLLASIAGSAAAEDAAAPYRGPGEQTSRPRTFDKQITDKLGISKVAYLLAVDVNGKVTPFIPDNSKSSFRIIDPAREKLTMDLYDIEPFTLIAGKRNPFCVLFVGGSGRKLWMESCP